jgi:signal transduction histidine kinase/ActR/RegA family two-component response regulator
VAQRGFSPAFGADQLRYQPDKDWARMAVVEGRPYVTREKLEEQGRRVGHRGKAEGVQSWAMIPLVSRGRVLGVLLAASRELDKFDEEEVELLETLGPDLGVAIENAQLFELVQRGRNEWQSTFDSVDERLAVLDAGLKLIRANRALLKALGRPPSDVIGRACREVFPETCASDCPHAAALEGERVEREVRSGGRILHVVTYPAASGGVIHVANDVTAERKREEQLIQAEKLSAASTVLAGVAHELNNPLTVVIAYSDLLSQLEETTAYREEVQQILRSALRCQSIVRNLLAFSRRDEPLQTEVDVNQLVRDTLPLFAYQLRVGGVRVEERLNPTVPPIAGDRNRLQQILVNVLNNAYQAIVGEKRAGYLRVATRARDGQIEVEVTDDGPGIAAANLPRVFEPFFTTKPPGQGTGLGLALSLQIARDHGGDILIESSEGRGTTVRVVLPVAPATAPAVEEPGPRPGALRGKRILVVDDEPDVRSLVGAALETFGAEVAMASNGREALQRLERDPAFDLVFTDLRMPEMGGDGLVEALRARLPHLVERVLLTTGDVAAPAADEAIRASGRPCLPKPFNVRELVAAIERLLREREGAAPAGSL